MQKKKKQPNFSWRGTNQTKEEEKDQASEEVIFLDTVISTIKNALDCYRIGYLTRGELPSFKSCQLPSNLSWSVEMDLLQGVLGDRQTGGSSAKHTCGLALATGGGWAHDGDHCVHHIWDIQILARRIIRAFVSSQIALLICFCQVVVSSLSRWSELLSAAPHTHTHTRRKSWFAVVSYVHFSSPFCHLPALASCVCVLLWWSPFDRKKKKWLSWTESLMKRVGNSHAIDWLWPERQRWTLFQNMRI